MHFIFRDDEVLSIIDAQKRVIFEIKSPFNLRLEPEFSFSDPVGERCTESLDAVSDIKARLCGVVDWLFENPDYDPKPRVIPKDKYPVLVDVTF